MSELYDWVRNITFYLIFITVVSNLLPNQKYERYLKLFAGMVLILLVIKPLTGSLRLEDKIAYYFEAISFQNDAEDLKKELLGMEDKRLEHMVYQYEEAVKLDLEEMVKDAGFYPLETQVEMEKDHKSEQFGTVISVFLKVTIEKIQETAYSEKAETVLPIEPISAITIEEIKEETEKNVGKGREERPVDDSSLNVLRRKISDYYNLEAEYVEVQMEHES